MDTTTPDTPLAARIRPETLEDFHGQEKIVGDLSFLKKAIAEDKIPSMIFWGPPGSGKTTLAGIIAKKTKAEFIEMSATSSGLKNLKLIIEQARKNKEANKKTIVFIDEIHRWNKLQQDSLLPLVERGNLILIGATTENPSFEINSALLSRTRIVVFSRLTATDIAKILARALKDKEKGLGDKNIQITREIIALIAKMANGDARNALNILEICAEQDPKITVELVQKVVQKSNLYYDQNGEEHYNIISALHKSMRGGDPNASIYWLVRMLEAGEDPLYIARRLLRFASEDVGLADNFAVVLASNVFDACHKIGVPECNVHLTQLVIYLARAPKSISAYVAYQHAQKDVLEYGNLPVPLHLRNAPTQMMKDLGYSAGYKYTPLEDSSSQEYLPSELKDKKYL